MKMTRYEQELKAAKLAESSAIEASKNDPSLRAAAEKKIMRRAALEELCRDSAYSPADRDAALEASGYFARRANE